MAAQTLSKLPIPSLTHSISRNKPNPSSISVSTTLTPRSLHSSWLGINGVSVQSPNFRPYVPKNRPIIATISFSLPTAKQEIDSSAEKIPKWSWRSIKSFAMGELEARKLKYPNTGTQALLMGILIEGTGLAAKLLRENGITLFKVREEAVKILGKADMFYFSPEHPPLTEAAQRALDRAIDLKLKSGEDGEVTTVHLLLGIWSESESPGHKIMAGLGFNDEIAKQLESLTSEPEL